MYKYYVTNYDCKECIYEGYNESKALEICRQYNKACGDWYVNDEEIDTLYLMENEDGNYIIREYVDENFINGYIKVGQDVTVSKANISECSYDELFDEDEKLNEDYVYNFLNWEVVKTYKA